MTVGIKPVAGKGNKVLILKQASTIEEAIAAAKVDMGDETHWDVAGYVAAITPPSMSKEVTSENYLDSDDGYADKTSGTKDAGELGFQLGYAPGLTVQQRLVDLFDVVNGEQEKWWYGIKSPTEDPEKFIINMYYGILNSLGTPTSIENSADMKRDVKIALQGRPKLAEDFLRPAA